MRVRGIVRDLGGVELIAFRIFAVALIAVGLFLVYAASIVIGSSAGPIFEWRVAIPGIIMVGFGAAMLVWHCLSRVSVRKLLITILVVAILIIAFLGVTYTQPVSRVHIMAYVGSDYGDVGVTVYLDGELVGNKDVSWSMGPFDEAFNVVPGKHVVYADWSKSVDGMTNETMRIQVGPFSTRNVYLFHGVGMA